MKIRCQKAVLAVAAALLLAAARAHAQGNTTVPEAPSTPQYATDRVIVMMRSDVATAMAASQEGLKFESAAGALGAQVYTITDGVSVQQKIQQLQSHPAVLAVEPDYKVHVFKTPDDQYLSKQWHLDKVQAMDAWNYSTGGTVKVCHVDSGVRIDHPDLMANVVKGWNMVPPGQVDGTPPPSPTDPAYLDFNDTYGHGTHTAGIIGAVGNNVIGVSGMNWRVQLYVCRFIWNDGSGYISDAMNCISLCSAEGAMITSNSWGGIGYSDFLKQEIQNAQQRGQLFVVASGNSGQNLDAAPLYPASYDLPNMISVASTGITDQLSSFSNLGANSVDIAAPGEAIYSTTYNGQYGLMWGTSMATPIVSGLAALLQAQAQASGVTLTYSQLAKFILSNGDVLPSLQGQLKTGARVNAFKAAQAVSQYLQSIGASALPAAPPSPAPAAMQDLTPAPAVPRPSPSPSASWPTTSGLSLQKLATRLVCGTSLLHGKRARQSSVASGSGTCGLGAPGTNPYVAARAVDGRCQGQYTNPVKGSCAMTNVQDDPWWQAGLGNTTRVVGVALTTRSDCSWAELGGAQIWVGPRFFRPADAVAGSGFTHCATVPAAGIARGQRRVFGCRAPAGVDARVVAVYLPKKAARLTLCEVDVITQQWLLSAAAAAGGSGR